MHRIDWDDLRYVLAVADLGSLVAAARALGVSHSTVLRRTRSFEQRLGVSLFEHQPGGYVLTSAGEELIATARNLDETINGLERRLRGQDLRPTGTVRIATTDTLAFTILGAPLRRLADLHPGVLVELTISNSMVSLTKREADVALRPAKNPPEHLVGRRIAEVAFAVYGSPGYLSNAPAKRELAKHTWVAPDESLSGTTLARWMKRQMKAAPVGFRADSLYALREAASAGLGIAALPCYLGDTAPGLTRIRGCVRGLATELWLLTHEDLRGTVRVRAVLDVLAAGLADQRDLFEGRRPRR